MAAKIAKEIAFRSASGYAKEFHSRVLPREARRLGDEFGLTAIGVNLVTIHPGKESSLRRPGLRFASRAARFSASHAGVRQSVHTDRRRQRGAPPR
jgi:hypothetical protein